MESFFKSINRSWNTLFDMGRNVQWLYWIGPYVLLAVVALILCIVCGLICREEKHPVLLALTCVFGIAAFLLAWINARFWSMDENLWMSYALMGVIGAVFLGMLTLDISAFAKKK